MGMKLKWLFLSFVWGSVRRKRKIVHVTTLFALDCSHVNADFTFLFFECLR